MGQAQGNDRRTAEDLFQERVDVRQVRAVRESREAFRFERERERAQAGRGADIGGGENDQHTVHDVIECASAP